MEKIRALNAVYLQKIEENLSHFITEDSEYFAELNTFLCGESKRIRANLCLLYLRANGVNVDEKILTLLTLGELIHNASLLHDDVIDNETVRRGLPTLFDKYGSKISLILGDYLLSIAVEQLMSLGNTEIIRIFSNSTKKMCKAEVVQYSKRNGNISLPEYVDIILGKTASLFSAILKSSAVLCNLDEKLAENLGKNFGILFQINNDQNPISAQNDKLNGIKTATDILGIEKTQALKDNYKEKTRECLLEIPENEYRLGIEDLVDLL